MTPQSRERTPRRGPPLMTVTFDQYMGCGHPYAYQDGYKIIPSFHSLGDVTIGSRWKVQELVRWNSGSMKSPIKGDQEIGWSAVIYVHPVERVA